MTPAGVDRCDAVYEEMRWKRATTAVIAHVVSSPDNEHYACRVSGTRKFRAAPRNTVLPVTERPETSFRYSV